MGPPARTGAGFTGSRSWPADVVTAAELDLLAAACEQMDVRPWPYEEHDHLTNVLLTVLDLQMRNVVVEKSIRY